VDNDTLKVCKYLPYYNLQLFKLYRWKSYSYSRTVNITFTNMITLAYKCNVKEVNGQNCIWKTLHTSKKTDHWSNYESGLILPFDPLSTICIRNYPLGRESWCHDPVEDYLTHIYTKLTLCMFLSHTITIF
jgi:hypothetical protein